MADQSSTRFPFISLEKALSKAEALFKGDRSGKAMPVATAFELWGYSPKSSGGFQTTGALKYYGLLEDEGSNADRKLRLTQEARRYFLDERDDVRADMLKEFALKPAMFQVLWGVDGWSSGIPADTVARSHLKLVRGMNDQSARSLLAIFKENIQFAGLRALPDPGALAAAVQKYFVDDDQVPNRTVPHTAGLVNSVIPEVDESMAAAWTPNWPHLQRQAQVEPGTMDARIVGDRVVVSADVDLKGLNRLIRRLTRFKEMLDDEAAEDMDFVQ